MSAKSQQEEAKAKADPYSAENLWNNSMKAWGDSLSRDFNAGLAAAFQDGLNGNSQSDFNFSLGRLNSPGADPLLGQSATRTVQDGDTYARLAKSQYGDERYAALIMAANGIMPTYANVHGLQVGVDLTLPTLNGFTDEQKQTLLTAGGRLIAKDQQTTDQIETVKALAELQAKQQADAAASAQRKLEIDAAIRRGDVAVVSQGTWDTSAPATPAPVGYRDNVTGQWVDYSRAGLAQEYAADRQTDQFMYGLGKGAINGVPELLTTIGKGYSYLGAAAWDGINAIVGNPGGNYTEGAVSSLQSTTGRLLNYSNPTQEVGGFVGSMISPALYGKAAQIGFKGFQIFANSGLFTNELGTEAGVLVLRSRLPVQLGDAGRFGDLSAGAIKGDLLTPHHMPQAALNFTSRADGGALVLSEAEHQLTRTYGFRGALTAQMEADLPFRSVLARDIMDVKSFSGTTYNPGINNLLNYYRNNFPDLMKK